MGQNGLRGRQICIQVDEWQKFNPYESFASTQNKEAKDAFSQQEISNNYTQEAAVNKCQKCPQGVFRCGSVISLDLLELEVVLSCHIQIHETTWSFDNPVKNVWALSLPFIEEPVLVCCYVKTRFPYQATTITLYLTVCPQQWDNALQSQNLSSWVSWSKQWSQTCSYLTD